MMARFIIHIIMGGVTCFAVGTVAGGLLLGTAGEVKSTLSPFLIIAIAVLLASAGYALTCLPFGGRNRERRGGNESP